MLVGAAVFGFSAASSPSVGETLEGFRAAAAGYRYEFPRDHGAHDEFRTEWWYYTGHLRASNGRRFGFELTFFRRGIPAGEIKTRPSQWSVSQLYLAHFAISDLDRQQFHYAEKVSRAGLGKAGADEGRLNVWIDHWLAESLMNEPARHRLEALQGDLRLSLHLTSEKPPTVHGRGGISRKGASEGQASHYYSLTRLAATGSITVGAETFDVTGLGWMDHEFGSADLDSDLVGWDWFSVQMDDRTELMLYRLRRTDGSSDPSSSGTLIHADGTSEYLPQSEFGLEPSDEWISPNSRARYPQRWRITVPRRRLSLDVTSLLRQQELVTTRSTQVTYWEGAARVSGTRDGNPVTGQGYVELTGYAERFSQKL